MYLLVLNGLFLLRAIARVKGTRVLYWAVLLGLFIFSAFRFRVGCDWSGYYNNYVTGFSMEFVDALSMREPLWWLTQVALNRADIPYPWINVLTSAIFFVGVHSLARRQPDRLGFLVLLFPILIINMPMSGIRQAAAIGLFCLSILELIDRRPVRFVVWTLLASTIHTSAMAFLVLTPLATGRFSWARIALTALLAAPAILVLSQRDEFQLAVDRYVDTGVEAFGAVFRVGLLALSGLYFFLTLRRKWSRDFPEDYGVINLGASMMVLLVLLVPFSTVIADRFGYYLVPFQTMIFARIPFLHLGKGRQLQAIIPYAGLLLVFTYWSLNSLLFQSCYVPYQSWLFGYPEGIATLPFE